MKKIGYVGGGGGVSNVVPGLGDDFDVTAILTTFDDGGSTGRLREVYQSPLVGDIRRAFAALGTSDLAVTFNHRFTKGDIKGHALGNIILTAMYNHYQDPEVAMGVLHQLCQVKGKVLGVSYDLATLFAELEDGTVIEGEHNIDEPRQGSAIKKLWLKPDPKPAPGVIEAIKAADLIIIGPGDLFSSLIPPLLVPGVSEAIKKSSAKKMYFVNNFSQPGQTDGYKASDHVKKDRGIPGC